MEENLAPDFRYGLASHLDIHTGLPPFPILPAVEELEYTPEPGQCDAHLATKVQVGVDSLMVSDRTAERPPSQRHARASIFRNLKTTLATDSASPMGLYQD